MTLRKEIQAKIDAIKAKAAADVAAMQEAAAKDVAELEAHLAAGGSWLEQEGDGLKAWAENLVAKVRAAL